MAHKHLVVFYHHPCNDGYLAACALKQQLNTDEWDSVRYVGMGHSELARLPHLYGAARQIRNETTHVICLDICPRADVLKWLVCDQSLTVAVLDHHETAKDHVEDFNYSGLLYTIADDFSGASLVKALGSAVNDVFGYDAWTTWREVECKRGWVFANNDLYQMIEPSRIATNSLYDLAEIRDIWLEDSPYKDRADAYAEWMRESKLIEGELQDIGGLEQTLEADIAAGEIIMQAVNAQADAIVEVGDHFEVTINSGQVVQCLMAELSHQLATPVGASFRKRHPDEVDTLAVGYFMDGGSEFVSGLGLRSTGGFARAVAVEFDGGGHDDAAGATIKDMRLTVAALKQSIIDIMQAMD